MMKLPRATAVTGACAACVLGRASNGDGCPFHDTTFTAGSVILRQGEEPSCVWLLRAGTVLLTSTTAGGEETECALRGPGAMIGLEALTRRPAGYEAWALSEVTLCRLSSESFRAWVGDLQTPAGAVAALAIEEGERRRGERVALAGQARQRVARFLVERLRLEGDNHPLPVEQQVLARMLGMKPETMSRALARLRDAGAIAGGRGVRIIDPEVLERIADGAD
jgi:CRP/FNR family cyclic AMP-dependent transcriptional regulator